MPWLLSEDAAMKAKLSGLTVDDVNAPTSGRPVTVRFRLPETELADVTFPMLVIEHAGIVRDPEREHRGEIRLPYIPEAYPHRGIWPLQVDVVDGNATLGAGQVRGDPNAVDNGVDERLTPVPELDTLPYFTEFPEPVTLFYQVTAYSRKALHDRQIVSALASWDRLPFRFGFLEIPQDGTVRRIDVEGPVSEETDKDRDGKRIFRSIYSVRVSSELLQGEVNTYQTVLSNPDILMKYQLETYG